MNIFVLDESPALAAKYHADAHVNKMILEAAQMLCSVRNDEGYSTPYKTTHLNHPCTRWVAESKANAYWLVSLARELNKEAKRRYGKSADHKSWSVIQSLGIRSRGTPTPFALAMPEELKSDDVVEAYRAYYRTKPKMEWRYSPTPYWY